MAYDCTLTDFGYTAGELARSTASITASWIRQAAAAAIAIDNANRLVDNYKKQRDISDRMLDIAEEQQNHLSTVFWPREAQFLAEFSTPETVEAVETMGRRYAGRLISTIALAFSEKLKEAKCSAPRYCTSASNKALQDILMARGAAMANARALGRNIAFAEFQARHDVNIERRMQAVAIGRDLMQQAASLYQAAGQGLAAAQGVLSEQFRSAAGAFMYERNRSNDLRQDAYQQAQRAINAQPMPTEKRAPVPGINTTFGAKSSDQSMADINASDQFKKSDTRNIIPVDQGHTHNEQAEAMNAGQIGGL